MTFLPQKAREWNILQKLWDKAGGTCNTKPKAKPPQWDLENQPRGCGSLGEKEILLPKLFHPPFKSYAHEMGRVIEHYKNINKEDWSTLTKMSQWNLMYCMLTKKFLKKKFMWKNDQKEEKSIGLERVSIIKICGKNKPIISHIIMLLWNNSQK